MLKDPRAPVIVGSLAIFAFAVFLAARHPSPRPLSGAHTRVISTASLLDCTTCHTSDGLTAGCLACHVEIASQLDNREGYHDHLLRDAGRMECRSCHPDHLGDDFPLVGQLSWGAQVREEFDHPHVEYDLSGKHAELSCDDCHYDEGAVTFALPSSPEVIRKHTYLGVDQKCVSCHGEPHGDAMFTSCTECHDQEKFSPAAHFDHAEHFPLENGHAEAPCDGCHLQETTDRGEDTPITFHNIRGSECSECHESPHRVDWKESCEKCHAEDASPWQLANDSITAEIHALTGFSLDKPHDVVECAGCHEAGPEFDARYPDPASATYHRQQDNCQGCHEDVHGGQFLGAYPACLDCHAKTHFSPSNFGVEEHEKSYPLVGTHAKSECESCHEVALLGAKSEYPQEVRIYVTTPRECAACHEDVHGGQFLATYSSCESCHSQEAFAPSTYGIEEHTTFALEGVHAKTECDSCHKVDLLGKDSKRPLEVQIFVGTARECFGCHDDEHRGQFAKEGLTDCQSCHPSVEEWNKTSFDHDTQSRFKLDETHSSVECSGCHPAVKLPGDVTFVQYRPIGIECNDCHTFDQ
jgi:hypothetical protein